LFAIFYYKTAEARERRVRVAIEDALKVVRRLDRGAKGADLE
jgi:hypothetical protein